MFKDSRTKYVCLQKTQANKDPFVRAWFFQIPKTTKAKAVYQYNRYDKNWTPYEWDGLTLNPRLPENIPEDTFRIIDEQCKPHPLPRYQRWLLTYVFTIHLPLVLLGVFWLNFMNKDQKNSKKDKDNIYNIIFVVFILILSGILLVMAIAFKLRYLHNLKERVKSMTSLIADLNNSRYLAQGFRYVVGNSGAWIELQLINQGIQMVEGGVPDSSREHILGHRGFGTEMGLVGNQEANQAGGHLNTPF